MTKKFEELMANLPLKEDIVELYIAGVITRDEYDQLEEANIRAQPNRRSPLSQDIMFRVVDE